MRVLILVFMMVATSVFADSAMILKKGWQLIGSTTKIKDMSIFKSSDVDQIWHYDASTQKWRGYSPDSKTLKKIKDRGFKEIDTLKSWHGFWIKSKQDWTLTLANDKIDDTNITLKKGWNLISLPINSTISPHIFDGKTLWKYTKDREWQFFDNDNSEDFKPISYLSNSDGFWVKSDKDQVISIADEVAKVHNFKDMDELKAYIKDMVILGKNWYGGYCLPIAINSSGAPEIVYDQATNDSAMQKVAINAPKASNTTDTNIQEMGVDEADVIKHNDKFIFYLSSDLKGVGKKYVNVTTFQNIANNDLKPITTFQTAGDTTELYLIKDKLVVLSRNGSNYKPEVLTKDESLLLKKGADISSMIVEIYDVSDISDIKREHIYKINGYINSSRLIDDKLYLITSFRPFVRYSYPKIYVDMPECKEYFNRYQFQVGTPVHNEANSDSSKDNLATVKDIKDYSRCYNLMIDEDGKYYRYDYEHPNITFKKLIPEYKKDDEDEKSLIEAKKFYASDKKDQEAIITTLSKIDILNGEFEDSSSFLGHSNTIYASQKSLYIVSQNYPRYMGFYKNQFRSAIYKFALGEDMGYRAFGFVKGDMLNQFSLSEYKDILRVATTEGTSWQDNTKNSLFTLKTVDNSLIISGALTGLGKKGENIYAVRFLDEKGFVVTFKRTDPFYTIDLSDANNPRKAGELEISGYSSYLHPVGEDLILGFGRDATDDGRVAELKLELFDISDLNNPLVKDSYTFANTSTSSQIEHDHRALSFRDSDKFFAFAYTKYAPTSRYYENKLGVYQIEGEHISVFDAIDGGNNIFNSFERGLFFDLDGESYVAFFDNAKISYKKISELKKER